ncbi:segregation and condensation protein A [Variovorax sp. LT1P1]|uniref:segregation and condensation protein A n=1 Tax=Variovorax sp. LT1P1 TaxID=3443730 RepID=UPI003F468774
MSVTASSSLQQAIAQGVKAADAGAANDEGDDPIVLATADADQVAMAHLYGEPMFAMPSDLYIPPAALQVSMEAFDGPMDLLLYLIRKQNFNILDIPMAGLTRQYLAYVDQVRETNLEMAAEYLLMAATLIEIKSRMLLPPKRTPAGEDAEDPRAELVRRLLEYEQTKLQAETISVMPTYGRDFWKAQVHVERTAKTRFPEVDATDLRDAWAEILKRARLIQHHRISREELSVREHMSIVLRRLQGRQFLEFEKLFDVDRGVPVLIVTFIALLELGKETLVEITQAEAFAPIYVRLSPSTGMDAPHLVTMEASGENQRTVRFSTP